MAAPHFLDAKGRARYNSWRHHSHLTEEEAIRQYVDLVRWVIRYKNKIAIVHFNDCKLTYRTGAHSCQSDVPSFCFSLTFAGFATKYAKELEAINDVEFQAEKYKNLLLEQGNVLQIVSNLTKNREEKRGYLYKYYTGESVDLESPSSQPMPRAEGTPLI